MPSTPAVPAHSPGPATLSRLDEQLAALASDVGRVTARTDLSPRILHELGLRSVQPAPSARWRATALRVGLAAALLLATAGVVVAASPDARAYLRTVGVAISGKGDRVTGLHPVPAFAVFQPTYLPGGLRLVVQAYAPGPAAAGRQAPVAQASSLVTSTQGGSTDADAALAQRAKARVPLLLGDTRGGALVTIYAAVPDAADVDRVVEVSQRPAAGRSLPAGERIRLRSTEAIFTVEQGRDPAGRERRNVLAWIDHGTFVEIHTTLARSEVLHVAEGLQQTALEPPSLPEKTLTGSARTPVPAPPSPAAPPAQRIASVETPRPDRQAIVRRCGPWAPEQYRTNPPASYQQALCVARAVAGANEGASSGLSRSTWREAAARLGFDPAIGPRGDTTVWLAQLGGAAGEQDAGQVVVLDATTGEPYVLVTLKPVPR